MKVYKSGRHESEKNVEYYAGKLNHGQLSCNWSVTFEWRRMTGHL